MELTDAQKSSLDIIKEAVAESLKSGGVATLNDVTAVKDDFAKRLEGWMAAKPVTPVPAAAVTEAPKAHLEEAGVKGMLNQVSGFEVWGIPVGQAAAGGFIAVMATELVDGFMSKQDVKTRGIVKLVAAGAIVKFGGKYIGSTAGKAVALLMAFDAIRDLTPIDAWAAKAASKVTKVMPSAGLADKANRRGYNMPNRGIPDTFTRAFERRAG